MNESGFPTPGGGVLFDLPGSWIGVGGQGEAFFSPPYVAGRGTVSSR